ncbi:MAG: hypothetical protein J6A26_02445 [Oscillospiraceae bacterium]|nr:hypothetical protein [Oscillospiraceae bacterium]
MKKLLAFLLAAAMSLSLTACGGMSKEQQLIADVVNETIQSEDFAQWQTLFKEFTGNTADAPEVRSVLHYQIDDFEGEKADCYLINISADIGYWINEANQEGASSNKFQICIDNTTNISYDSIHSDAANFNGDVSTAEGRALYLLWIYLNMANDDYSGSFLNDTEIVTEFSEKDIQAINDALSK